jgi:hypothetical protein
MASAWLRPVLQPSVRGATPVELHPEGSAFRMRLDLTRISHLAAYKNGLHVIFITYSSNINNHTYCGIKTRLFYNQRGAVTGMFFLTFGGFLFFCCHQRLLLSFLVVTMGFGHGFLLNKDYVRLAQEEGGVGRGLSDNSDLSANAETAIFN